MFLVNHNRKVIMKVITKVASTSLKIVFYQSILFDDKNNIAIRNLLKEFDSQKAIEIEGYIIEPPDVELLQKKGYKLFIFVRNPYRRCVSGYLNKFVDSSDLIKEKLLKPNFVEHLQAIYHDVWNFEKLPKNSSISFLHFVKYLERNDLNKVDGHWMPQSIISGNVIADYVIKIENLQRELSILFDYIGIDKNYFEIEQNNRTHYQKDVYDANVEYFRLKGDALLNIDLPNYKHFLKEELQRRIYNIYRSDFDRFNYSYELT
jgi:hypothetical protein